jgi:hypothetical protein
LIERGGLRAEVEPADVVALSDEMRPPVDDDKPLDSAYAVSIRGGVHRFARR